MTGLWDYSTKGAPVKRKRMRSFRIEELSLVDKPAQEGALATIIKRDSRSTVDAILKYYMGPVPVSGSIPDNRAKGFAELLRANMHDRAQAELAQNCWPLFGALDTSLRSIVGDPNLEDEKKLELMRDSTNQFLTAIRAKLPSIDETIQESLDGVKHRSTAKMATIGQLQKQMGALGKKLDAVVTKLQRRDETDERRHRDDESFFKGGDDEEAAAARLQNLFGANKAGDEEEEFSEEEEIVIGTEGEEEEEDDDYQMKAGDDYEMMPPPRKNRQKAADTDEGEGLVTTEGEEEEPIAAGDTEPIGEGDKDTRAAVASKRVRMNKGTDESLMIGDQVIMKSRVGADMFSIIKAQQAQVKALEKVARQERDARELVEYGKVADDELSELPGTPERKARLLKRLSHSLDSGDRQLLTSMLRAGNRASQAAFKTYGHGGGDSLQKARGGSNFEKRVADIRSRDGGTRVQAMQKARVEYPDEFEAYQNQ